MALKHKKILKNFNFPKMLENARKEHSDLIEREKRFKFWIVSERGSRREHKFLKRIYNILFNKEKYCFKIWTNCESCNSILLNGYNDTTESEKKFIGHYFYSNFDKIQNKQDIKYVQEEHQFRDKIKLFEKVYKYLIENGWLASSFSKESVN